MSTWKYAVALPAKGVTQRGGIIAVVNLNGTKDRERSRFKRHASTALHPLRSGLTVLWYIVPGLLFRCGVLPPDYKISLDRFFTPSEITRRLVRLRVRVAKKRHDQHFLFNLNTSNRKPGSNSPAEVADICSMMPPRRTWIRPGVRVRQKRTAQQVAELSVLNKIEISRRDGENHEWQRKLTAFTTEVTERLRNIKNIAFCSPTLAFKIKDAAENTFRPIATYNLKDQIFLGLAANQLRETIDPLLLKNSYAFRVRNNSLGRAPQHHDAVTDLRSYILAHRRQSLYVAECDIQKFFDTVNHDVAKACLKHLLRELRHKGEFYDRRLEIIYEAYLQSYNYPNSVDAVASTELERKGIKGGSVPWVRPALMEIYGGQIPDGIGVPQGGALSPIIANIVLHSADLAVHNCAYSNNIKNYFYARYCDDMVLITTEESDTAKLFEAYLSELAKLKLPFHKPKQVSKFSKDFFDYKSKATYNFGPISAGGIVPWIAFLGYHVRYDGRLRVRKNSITKEIEKQITVCKDVARSISRKGNKMRVSPKQAHHRARMRLLAMSVGRSDIHAHGPEIDHEMCWTSGFLLLKKHPHVRSQLKILDRSRKKLLLRLEKKLDAAKAPAHTTKNSAKDFLKYYGRPFSYYAQFNPSKSSQQKPSANTDSE